MGISSRNKHQIKREQAKARQVAFDALTDEQRLQKLLDAGNGQCKEAQRYQKRIGASNASAG